MAEALQPEVNDLPVVLGIKDHPLQHALQALTDLDQLHSEPARLKVPCRSHISYSNERTAMLLVSD